MKAKFSKEVRFVPTWRDNTTLPESEQLVFTLKPLKIGELLDVLDVFKRADFEKGDHTTLTPEQMRVIVSEAGTYLPVNANMAGAEGFDINDVIGYSEFFGLAAEVIFELVRLSSPSGTDVKN